MSEFKSEIRDSKIIALEEKVSKGSYGKYVRSLVLKRIRGFTDREVTFDFPVSALVGPNGGGKTTVLGAAGLIYREVAPRTFFAKSGTGVLGVGQDRPDAGNAGPAPAVNPGLDPPKIFSYGGKLLTQRPRD
ncbi:AAA family ATPase [Mycobacterium sp.]|uniref:AAA family ATPase n=1 Tax=Mycobacterium sp. TaxID=1785 RepID=UPI003F988405